MTVQNPPLVPSSLRITSEVFTMTERSYSGFSSSLIPSSFLPLTHGCRHTCLPTLYRNSPCFSCLRSFVLTLFSAWKIPSHRSLPVSYSYSIKVSDQIGGSSLTSLPRVGSSFNFNTLPLYPD